MPEPLSLSTCTAKAKTTEGKQLPTGSGLFASEKSDQTGTTEMGEDLEILEEGLQGRVYYLPVVISITNNRNPAKKVMFQTAQKKAGKSQTLQGQQQQQQGPLDTSASCTEEVLPSWGSVSQESCWKGASCAFCHFSSGHKIIRVSKNTRKRLSDERQRAASDGPLPEMSYGQFQ
ncbi:unnamed protein product [Polarella glacialis]|uniref:Uncharacterized protein n=1 Tax=Polarella glacialis TaxID=89957 RepID=A0A813D7Y5_POLGL|nr:unnamed protein product [Polarella glacialis]